MGFTEDLATLNINFNDNFSHSQWIFNYDNIQAFELLCRDNEPLRQRLKESVNLIPIDDPFVTSYAFHISSSLSCFHF